ncbi:MAG: putative MFS family arabinose efflux permease [Candidatus Poriferisodalaceae bacterium]|jgi:predicted MFS family arabinose efflux permease
MLTRRREPGSGAPLAGRSAAGGWLPVVALGIVTITSYGAWFYAFGILIGPIARDTGWSEANLAFVFGSAQVLNGVLAPFGGRLLDRFGGLGPFGSQAIVGGGLLFGATFAESALVFGILYAIGAGYVGATGFYHVTTAAAARIGPGIPARSIAVLTAIGAFCSFIYLPLGQLAIEAYGWRAAARIFALTAVGGALLATWLAGGGASPNKGGPSPHPLRALRAAIGVREIRWMFAGYAFAGAAFSSVLLFQVPIMESVGISAGTAALLAGTRGACQFFGRVGLIATVASRGALRSLQVAYAVAAVGTLLILVGSVSAATGYAIIVGVALGAASPLQAIHGQEVFDPDDLGMLMGLQHSVFSVAGGIGPVAIGLVRSNRGSYTSSVFMISAAMMISVVLLGKSRAPIGD